jgi:GT2 family glycosyltransferase
MQNYRKQIELSISIVNYNTIDKTKNLIDSIYNYADGISSEILLVDNASNEGIDDIIKQFPEVKVIQNQLNVFFTKADNQNLARAKGKYILSINSDTMVTPGTIKTMIDFLLKHPDVGAITPKIIYPDGSIQPSTGKFVTLAFGFYEVLGLNRFFPNHRAYTYVMPDKLDYDPEYPHEAEVLYGACIMIRREVLETVGLKDEKLIHGWDEYDWCKRMIQYGWKLSYVPNAVIIHHRGASREKTGTNSDISKILERYSWDGFFYLYKKHFGVHIYIILRTLFALNALFKTPVNLCIATLSHFKRKYKSN